MNNLINYHIWFKVCRPIKAKYNLTNNCLLMLNGIYIYCNSVKPCFTWTGIFTFVSYYNPQKVATYLTVLIKNGFINTLEKKGNRQYYSISEKGINVIRELEDNYSLAFSRFIDRYKIDL